MSSNRCVDACIFLCISDILFQGQKQHGEAAIDDHQILKNKIHSLKEKIQDERFKSIKVSSIGSMII